MARTRTTPQTNPSTTLDTLEQCTINIPYNSDGTVNKQGITLGYTVNNRSATGVIISSSTGAAPFSIWPQAVKSAARVLVKASLTDAENKVVIGAGTDTDDLA